MHEMSAVSRCTRIALDAARHAGAGSVERVVVQIGEMSGYLPRYMSAYYPAAVKGTLLEGSKLVVETLPAELFCLDCGTVYRPEKTEEIRCPQCLSAAFRIGGGTEIFVKEIVIKEENPAKKGCHIHE